MKGLYRDVTNSSRTFRKCKLKWKEEMNVAWERWEGTQCSGQREIKARIKGRKDG